MKIKITTIDPIGRCSSKFIPLVSGPHNVHYDSVKENCLYFHVSKYPTKEIMKHLMDKERKELKISVCFVRACFKVQGVRLCFVVRYHTKTGTDTRNRYTVDEKEAVFIIEADKAEIIQFVDPFVWHIRDENSDKSADKLLQWYNDWAHPLTLESVIESLTEDQKLKAAKILKEFFAA